MSFLLAPGTDAFSLRRSPCDDTQQTLISVSHLSRCFRCFGRLGFPTADPACSAYDAANALAKEKDAGPARAFSEFHLCRDQLAARTAAVSEPPMSQAKRSMPANPTTALAVTPQQDF
jgi:hypothetical protein